MTTEFDYQNECDDIDHHLKSQQNKSAKVFNPKLNLDIRTGQTVSSDTTFKQTEEFLINNGWEKINATDYAWEKHANKRDTARIGIYSFFRLRKTREEIKTGESGK